MREVHGATYYVDANMEPRRGPSPLSVSVQVHPVNVIPTVREMITRVDVLRRDGMGVGELLGVDRRAATLFTFYLAVPTMMGATILELHHKAGALAQGQMLNIAIGFVVSFVVAFFVIRQFLTIVTRYGLRPFGWYRIAAGIALIGYLAIH